MVADWRADNHPHRAFRGVRACLRLGLTPFAPRRRGRSASLSAAPRAACPASSGWAATLGAARGHCVCTCAAVCHPWFAPKARPQGLTPYAVRAHLPTRGTAACSHGGLRWRPSGHRMRVCHTPMATMSTGEVAHTSHIGVGGDQGGPWHTECGVEARPWGCLSACMVGCARLPWCVGSSILSCTSVVHEAGPGCPPRVAHGGKRRHAWRRVAPSAGTRAGVGCGLRRGCKSHSKSAVGHAGAGQPCGNQPHRTGRCPSVNVCA